MKKELLEDNILENRMMIALLRQENFSFDPEENEWTREGWTIRLYENEIEVFESLMKQGAKYHTCDKTSSNLILILDNIE